jgi:hypothetical protein
VAIEGDLVGMSMESLVQAMCLEKRRAALHLKRADREGVLFFDNGEIAHATLGPLVGEDAVYELVSWTEGTFRLLDYETLPRRTVAPGWNRHLLEGLRRKDERQLGAAAPAVPVILTAADAQQDKELEDDLIVLLSKLEQLTAGLGQTKKSQKPDRPPLVLRAIVATLGDAIDSVAIRAGGRVDLLMSLSEIHTVVQAMPAAGMRDELEKAYSRLQPVLRRYFSLVCRQFHSQGASDRCLETTEVFLDDMFRLLRNAELQSTL